MKCLSNSDEINATIGKTGPFSRKYFVSDVVSRLRVFNLLFTRITGYYLLKVLRKDNRRLAVASCTIPCQISLLYESHKKLKKLPKKLRFPNLIIFGNAGKKVFEFCWL